MLITVFALSFVFVPIITGVCAAQRLMARRTVLFRSVRALPLLIIRRAA